MDSLSELDFSCKSLEDLNVLKDAGYLAEEGDKSIETV